MIPISFVCSSEFLLLERGGQLSTILLSIAILSFALVGWSGINTTGFLNQLSKNFFRINPKDKEFKEVIKLNTGATFLLFLNFFIALSLCFFLLLNTTSSYWESVIFAIVTTSVFIFLQQFGFRFVIVLSGANEMSEAITLLNRNTWQFGGILLITLATIWTLNLNSTYIFQYIFVALMILMLFLRTVKGLVLTFKRRIRWYYFILYLCTLEILPAFVFIKLAIGFFQWEM